MMYRWNNFEGVFQYWNKSTKLWRDAAVSNAMNIQFGITRQAYAHHLMYTSVGCIFLGESAE